MTRWSRIRLAAPRRQFVLAVVGAGVYQGKQMRRSVDAAKVEAEATRQAADAATKQALIAGQVLAETQRDRELNWQPLLEVLGPSAGAYGPTAIGSMSGRIAISGRGPAYRAFYVFRGGPPPLS